MRSALVRVLAAYDEEGGLVAERVLAMPLPALRRLFGGEPDDDMRGVYRVTSEHAAAIAEVLGEPIDVESLAFFVESYDTDDGD